jgi:predicted DNA-binding transcriptional regulator AlpA
MTYPPPNLHQFPPDCTILPLSAVAEAASVSLSTLRREIGRGSGPKVTRISSRRLGVRLTDLRQWLEERSAAALSNTNKPVAQTSRDLDHDVEAGQSRDGGRRRRLGRAGHPRRRHSRQRQPTGCAMTSPPTARQRPDWRIDVRGLHDAQRLDAHPAHDSWSELAAALMLAARANAVEARRLRHPDRRTARRGRLKCPRAQSAAAYAVLVLAAEGLWGIHG